MRLDSHQHFWRYSAAEYPWMGDGMESLRRDHLPPDLQPLLEAAGFDGCIAVQARQSLAETEWLLGLAHHYPFIRGVVGWVDLRSPAVGEQLRRFAADPKLVGVRHVVQDEPDDAFLLGRDFQRGIAQLREHRLAYDILIYPRQLPAAIRFAEAFPDQRFVLDHLAKPVVRDGRMSPWREDLRQLGTSPNVFCKLSGLVTEAVWGRWKASDFTPYLDVAFEVFGPDRLMIGSDWPVCTVSADYGTVLRLVVDYLERFPAGIREKVMGGNGARFYGI
ncbi:MAG: amidohydrolase family protein [Verrucomicrobiales bacterium]|nr:amidohydrolase family protein [Verrucomicrobiales bacterium]